MPAAALGEHGRRLVRGHEEGGLAAFAGRDPVLPKGMLEAGRQGGGITGGVERHGLPVGSGVVKGACKQIVSSRFKRAGCRWSKAGANTLLAVICCLKNNRWTDFLDLRACRAAAA